MNKETYRKLYKWIHRNSYVASSFSDDKVIDLEDILEYLKTIEPKGWRE